MRVPEPMETIVTEPFVSTAEAAGFLGKPVSWVHNNAAKLGLPRYRVGRHWRYRLSEVARWVESVGR